MTLKSDFDGPVALPQEKQKLKTVQTERVIKTSSYAS